MSTQQSEQGNGQFEEYPKLWLDETDAVAGNSWTRWKKILIGALAFIVLFVLLAVIADQGQTIDHFNEVRAYEKSQEPDWYKLFPMPEFVEDESDLEDEVSTIWELPELEKLIVTPLGTEDYSDLEREQYVEEVRTDLCDLYSKADTYGFYSYARVRLGLENELLELVAAVSPYCSQGEMFARDFAGLVRAADTLEYPKVPVHPYKTLPRDHGPSIGGNEIVYQHLAAARALDNTVLASKTDIQLVNQVHKACEFVEHHDVQGAREHYAALDQEARAAGETKDHAAFFISQLNALQCSTTQEAIDSFAADFDAMG